MVLGHQLPLLVTQLLFICCHTATASTSRFFYQDSLNGSGEIHFNGVQLHVDSSQLSVFGARGANATLPCRYWYEPEVSSPRRVRVKWSWLPAAGGNEMDVLVAFGPRHRFFGDFRGRVHLIQDFPGDATLVVTELQLKDTGRYRCEVIDGLEDESVLIDLELQGVVFPYQPPQGRYRLNFQEAQQTCAGQDSVLATFEQLFQAWEDGLNWCNAGWLADGTVQYPVTRSREPCGGAGLAPGVRSYGIQHRLLNRYNAFCFSSSLRGKVYYLQNMDKLNFTEAQQACEENGATMAKVGQMYAAWRYQSLDRCDAGWVADGSLRYPISRPRANCGPPEPGVRSFGFPPLQDKHGVYCYSAVTEKT